jgi:hypothetical protein
VSSFARHGRAFLIFAEHVHAGTRRCGSPKHASRPCTGQQIRVGTKTCRSRLSETFNRTRRGPPIVARNVIDPIGFVLIEETFRRLRSEGVLVEGRRRRRLPRRRRKRPRRDAAPFVRLRGRSAGAVWPRAEEPAWGSHDEEPLTRIGYAVVGIGKGQNPAPGRRASGRLGTDRASAGGGAVRGRPSRLDRGRVGGACASSANAAAASSVASSTSSGTAHATASRVPTAAQFPEATADSAPCQPCPVTLVATTQSCVARSSGDDVCGAPRRRRRVSADLRRRPDAQPRPRGSLLPTSGSRQRSTHTSNGLRSKPAGRARGGRLPAIRRDRTEPPARGDRDGHPGHRSGICATHARSLPFPASTSSASSDPSPTVHTTWS